MLLLVSGGGCVPEPAKRRYAKPNLSPELPGASVSIYKAKVPGKDSYTSETESWLNQRFQTCDADGYYFAHQPIYGFRTGPHEPGTVAQYTITYAILQALGALKFRSLLDVGGAEGYKAALIREHFGVDVRSSDLSAEAVRRARDLFGVEGEAIDVHRLPYADGSFDVVLCSESLEHVPDFRSAARELFRVARRAVVITVPHEPESVIAHNREQKIPHAHLHALTPSSFDFLRDEGVEIRVTKLLSPFLKFPRAIAEARTKHREPHARFPGWIYAAYNRTVPMAERFVTPKAVAALIRFDEAVCRYGGRYQGMCFTIAKNPKAWRADGDRAAVTPEEILAFRIPLERGRLKRRDI